MNKKEKSTLIKGTVTIDGKAKADYKAGFLSAEENIKSGWGKVLSKSKPIERKGSQWNGKRAVSLSLQHRAAPVLLTENQLKGVYNSYKEKLSDPKKALPYLINNKDDQGYLNPELPFEVKGGNLAINF